MLQKLLANTCGQRFRHTTRCCSHPSSSSPSIQNFNFGQSVSVPDGKMLQWRKEKRESRSGWVNDHFQSWTIFPIAKGNKNKGWKMLSVWHTESRKRAAFHSRLQTGSLKSTHLSHIGFQWSLQYRCMCNYSPCPHTYLHLHTAWTRTH